MRRIPVATGRSYDILIGPGLLADCGAHIAAVKAPCRALLLCDDTVARLYADGAAASLARAGFAVTRFVFPAGEASKNFSTLAALLERMAEDGLGRGDLLAALGGGVAGDLGGFAAAVYLRGIDFVQLPTTLLAAVDASVGGKTAVDLPAGKNLAGRFWQPRLVLCDCAALGTLPAAVFSDGMAEVVKYGVILDAELLEYLESDCALQDMEHIVFRCCSLKRDVVERDEHDTGERQLLNFGHTIAHAVEKVSGYAVPHGSAVAIGMAAISRAAERHGCAPAGTAARIAALCRKFNLPTETALPVPALCAAAHSDKKRGGDGITVVVPARIGAAELKHLTLAELDAWIGEGVRA